MRLFVAVELDDNVVARLSSIQEKLSSGDFDLKLVEPGNLHLTLKFLGEVQESQVKQIESIISGSVNGFRPFTLSFRGIGCSGAGTA